MNIKDIARLLTEDPNVLNETVEDDEHFEDRLIDMSPESAQEVARRHPDHGKEEAKSKVYSIVQYGEDYHRKGLKHSQMAHLKALIKYWNLDKDLIRRWMSMDPETLAQEFGWL